MSFRPLSEVADINPRDRNWAAMPDEALVTFVPMAAVSETSASIEGATVRPLREVRKGYVPFANNDVILAKITPCLENGKVALAEGLSNGLGFGSTEFHVIRAREGVLPRYIFHCLRRDDFRAAARQSMRGAAGQQRVPAEFLANYSIYVPGLDEQQRIVRLLDRSASLRVKRIWADRVAGELPSALFDHYLGNPQSNPMAWPLTAVGEFVRTMQGGKSIAPAPSESVAGRFRILKVSAISGEEYDPSESKAVPAEYAPPTDHLVRAGDVLFSRASGSRALIGNTVYVADTPQNLLLPDKIWRFVWREPILVEPLFVWALFRHPTIRSRLSELASGVGVLNISMGKVLAMEVPLPPCSAQQRFVAALQRVRHALSSQRASASRLETLDRTLLDSLTRVA